MPSFKHQWFFEAETGEGFSEVWWDQNSTDLGGAKTVGIECALKRLAMLPSTYYCRYAKVHDMSKPRSVQLYDNTILGQQGTFTPTAPDNVEHQVDECVLLRMENDAFIVVHKYLHGIGTWVSQGEFYNPSLGFSTAMDAFITAIKSRFACRVYIDTLTPPAYVLKTILNAVPQKVTTRQPGRPFGMSVGARRKKKSPLTLAAKLWTSLDPATRQHVASGLMDQLCESSGTSRRKAQSSSPLKMLSPPPTTDQGTSPSP